MKIKIVLLLCLLLAQGQTRRHLKKDQSASEDKKVVESNHFSSQTQRSTTETLSNLQLNTSLIFTLKDQN